MEGKIYSQIHSIQLFLLNSPRRERGGGVAILVKKNIKTNLLKGPKLRSIEVVEVKLKMKDWDLEVVSAYCPHGPECEEEDIQKLFDSVGQHAIIGGDFNGHSYIWADGRNQNAAGQAIEEYLENSDRIPYLLHSKPRTIRVDQTRSTGLEKRPYPNHHRVRHLT